MDRYNLVASLLGLWDDEHRMPVFRGPRYRRYQSLDKILDLVEIASKSAPSFPRDAVFLNVYDDEWDDQMTYLSINYQWIFENALVRMGLPLALYVYNHNLIHYNIHYRMCKWFFPLVALYQFEVCYKYYRTQLQKALLFDEYCQARADELIAQREHLLYTPEMRNFLTWSIEFKNVMLNLKRDSFNNNPTDFKSSELRLQDFIRKWVNPAKGIQFPNAGPKYGITYS